MSDDKGTFSCWDAIFAFSNTVYSQEITQKDRINILEIRCAIFLESIRLNSPENSTKCILVLKLLGRNWLF